MDQCRCGTAFMRGSVSLVCSMECLAATFGGEIEWPLLARKKPIRAAWLPGEGSIPIPTEHMSRFLYWEKRTASQEDIHSIDDLIEAQGARCKAVSKAQVKWARAELAKVERGGTSDAPLAQLRALASTPLDGLPERATKKPKRTKAN
jgi:hypothetical protein